MVMPNCQVPVEHTAVAVDAGKIAADASHTAWPSAEIHGSRNVMASFVCGSICRAEGDQ
jgi:hypothetical protein